MLIGTESFDPAHESNNSSRSHSATVNRLANVFLTLPSIDHNVPITAGSSCREDIWARIALNVLDLVNENEIQFASEINPRNIVAKVLSHWASKHCSNINVLGGFSLTAAMQCEDILYSDFHENELMSDGAWFLSLSSTQTERYFNIKSQIEKMESLFPGLGHTAFHSAELASFKTFPLFSPNMAFQQAQNIYWYGLDNDVEFKDEYQNMNDGENDSVEDEELFMPSDFKKSFPAFMFNHENLLKSDQLDSIAASGDRFASEVAGTLLKIQELIDEGSELPGLSGCDVESAYFAGYVGWDKETDCLDRVLDDFYHFANEGSDSYTDLIGICRVPFEKNAFKKWQTDMENGFALYSQLDRLIQLIGIEN